MKASNKLLYYSCYLSSVSGLYGRRVNGPPLWLSSLQIKALLYMLLAKEKELWTGRIEEVMAEGTWS